MLKGQQGYKNIFINSQPRINLRLFNNKVFSRPNSKLKELNRNARKFCYNDEKSLITVRL